MVIGGLIMDNFKFHVYTEIFFGKGEIKNLPATLGKFGKNVLFAYGGGSIKKNGIYDKVMELLSETFNVVELANIEPNPTLDSVNRGVALCREHAIDVILAVGGGSVIDCTKAVAAAHYYQGDPWDLVLDSRKITKALPIVTVLTMAGTGSEMNRGSVITNKEKMLKLGMGAPVTMPQTTVIDPTYLYSLPPMQTAAGAIDTFSHVLESYFKKGEDAFIQDRISEAVMLTVINYAPIALKEPENYAARANLAWASSLALNGLTGNGKSGAWSVHTIEHELSAYYDLTHGVGLAIIIPAWLKHILNDQSVDRIAALGVNVFKISDQLDKWEIATKAIEAMEKFFTSLNVPMRLRDVGIDEEKFELMAEKAVKFGSLKHAYVPMTKEDVIQIYQLCK
jgi:alcohol dehydrogenase YqhD (iron-dependent ADH family)